MLDGSNLRSVAPKRTLCRVCFQADTYLTKEAGYNISIILKI
jgi:hypothetical protein